MYVLQSFISMELQKGVRTAPLLLKAGPPLFPLLIAAKEWELMANNITCHTSRVTPVMNAQSQVGRIGNA